MQRTRMMGTLGMGLGLVLCGWFLWHMDWPAAVHALRQVRPLPVAACMVCVGFSSLTRSWRWRLLAMGGHTAAVPLRRFWNAACVGYLANMVFPAKAGEVLRMAYLNRVTTLNAGQIMASALTDRLADIFGVALVACLLITLSAEQTLATSLRAVAPAMVLVPALALACLVYRPQWIEIPASVCIRLLPVRWQSPALHLLTQGLQALVPLRRPPMMIMVLGATLAAFMSDVLACWMLILAFDWPLPFVASMWLELAFAVGGCLPAAPGYIGVYQVAAVLTLGMYGISESLAVTYAFATQAVVLAVFALLGGKALYALRRTPHHARKEKS